MRPPAGRGTGTGPVLYTINQGITPDNHYWEKIFLNIDWAAAGQKVKLLELHQIWPDIFCA